MFRMVGFIVSFSGCAFASIHAEVVTAELILVDVPAWDAQSELTDWVEKWFCR